MLHVKVSQSVACTLSDEKSPRAIIVRLLRAICPRSNLLCVQLSASVLRNTVANGRLVSPGRSNISSNV